MLAGVDSVGIGINPVEGWNSWMILFFVGVIVVGVSLFESQDIVRDTSIIMRTAAIKYCSWCSLPESKYMSLGASGPNLRL